MSPAFDRVLAAIDAAPYAQYIGLQLQAQPEGLLALMPFAPHLIGNPAVPSLHGGILGGFMQLTAAARLMLQLGSDKLPRMSSITVQYLRPGQSLDTRARAQIISCGRRFASATVQAYQDDPTQPIATAVLQFILVD